MANEERVVLIAEVRDEATAGLDNINRSVDDTKKKVDDAAKSTEKSTRGMTSAFDRFSNGGSKAFQRFSGGAKKGIGDSTEALGGMDKQMVTSDSALKRFVSAGTKGLRNFRTGFKNLGAAQFESTGLMGTLGGMTQRFVRGLKGANGEAGGLAGTVGGAFRRIGTTIGGLVSKAASVGASIASSIGGALSTVAKRAGQVAGILGGIVIADALRGGVSRAMRLDEAEARMRGMGYEASKIDTLMDNASDAIMGTSYTLDDAATAAQQLSAAGVYAGDDMESVIGLIGDSAFVAGTEFNEMGDIWAQVAARGSLDGQIMNRMLSNGIEITDGLADQMGVTGDEIQDMISAGEVGFEDFAAAMETQFGGAAQEMSTTMSGAFGNVRAGLHMISAEVVGPFMEAFRGAFVYLQEPIFALSEVISPVFDALTGNVEGWADTALAAGETAADGIRTFVEPMEHAADLISNGMPAWQALADALDIDPNSGIGEFLNNVVGVASDLSPVVGVFRGIQEAGSEVGEALWDSLGSIFNTLANLAPVIGATFVTIGTLIAPILAQVLDTVAEILPTVVDLAATFLTALLPVLPTLAAAFANIMDALLPLLPVLVELAADILILVIDGIASLVTWFTDLDSGANILAGTVLTLMAGFAAYRGVLMAMNAAKAIYRGTLIAATVAQRGLNLAMRANPIGLIITAITALVAGLTWFFTQTEAGQQIWETVWGAIKTAASAVVEWFQDTALPILQSVWEGIASGATWLWEEVLQPTWEWIQDAASAVVDWFTDTALPALESVWDGIGAAAIWLWEEVLEPVFSFIGDAWGVLVDGIEWYWENILSPVITLLGDIFTWLWDEIVSPILGWVMERWEALAGALQTAWVEIIQPVLQVLGDTFTWLWEEMISPVIGWVMDRWGELSDTISDVWNNNLKPIFQAFGDFIMEDVVGWVQKGVGWIGDAWDSLKDLFFTPIEWVIDVVWNNGIAAAFNAVADAVGSGASLDPITLNRNSGGGGGRANVPGYAEGGLAQRGWAMVGEEGPELVNFSQSGRVYTADETQAMLSGGAEGVMPMGGGSPWYSNSELEIGRQAGQDAVGGALADAWDWVRGKLADGVEHIVQPQLDRMKGRSSGTFGTLTGDTFQWGFDNVMDWARGKDEEDVGGSYGGAFEANPGGFNRPMAGMISSMAGERSYVGRYGNMHYGVDIANSIGSAVRAAWSGVVKSVSGSGLDQTMVLNHGNYDTAYMHNSEILHAPGTDVTGGQIIARSGTAGSGPHLHFEVHPGGYYNPSIGRVNSLFGSGGGGGAAGALMRDTGGPVPPGLSLINNGTGMDEFMLNDHRFGQMEDVLDHVAAHIPTPAGGAGGGGTATATVDRRVTIESGAFPITIQNTGAGYLDADGLDQLKEAVEEIFEESARRDY